MHISLPTLPFILIASLPFAHAAGRHGFAIGAATGTGGNDCKDQAWWEDDFDAIKTNTGSTLVRTYSSNQCNTSMHILPAAKAKGFQVILGVWPDSEESLNAEITALKRDVTTEYLDQIYAITVGSETLYRGDFTGPELLDKINQVRAVVPAGIKMGTADSWNKFQDGTGDAVINGGVDIILANGFAYWQGKSGDDAVHTYFDDMAQALQRVQQINGSLSSIEFWNGETGWPTDGGTNYGTADAGTGNAASYYQNAVCGSLGWNLNSFYFEAFDEPWKGVAVGDNGQPQDETKWGIMYQNRTLKFPATC